MKLSKLLLAVVGATVLLGALVGSASAGRFSNSARSLNATWTTMNFAGGFGTVECEVVLEGTLHNASMTKTPNTLMGYITAGNVSRCRRGGATILRETLPWHVQYESFSGTLPNITAINTRVIGASWRIREPTFGVTCLARSTTTEPSTGGYTLTNGVITSTTVGGTIRCGSFTGTLSGSSSRTEEAGGRPITVTLI